MGNMVLNEKQLMTLIKESAKRVLKEVYDIDDDRYFGGGLPDHYFDDPEDEPIEPEDEQPEDGKVDERMDPTTFSMIANEMFQSGWKKLDAHQDPDEEVEWLNNHYWDLTPQQKSEFQQLWNACCP